jgi:glycosyltransferase involved in cell wall biosynthesis
MLTRADWADQDPEAGRSAVSLSDGITVLHIITGLGAGGAEAMLARLVLANPDSGLVRNVVISLLDDGVYATKLRDAGIDVYSLGLDRFSRLPARFLRLVLLVRRIRPDVVMTWLYHADLLGTLAAIASGLGAGRVIWNLRCSNIDFDNYAYTTHWIVKILAWLSPLPKAVTANSRTGQRVHEALGYRPRHWAFLPNGVDVDEYRPNERDRIQVRNELGFDASTFAVGMIARLDPQKDHGTFLAAAKMVAARWPHVRFVLVGRNTNELPAFDQVLTLGERRDIPRLLRGLDLVVLSSAYGEGSPNVLTEAMATGVLCITTDVGDSAALVGDSGIVIPPQNSEALAAGIDTLLSEAREARALRGQRARETILREWNIERTTELYHELCQFALPKDQALGVAEQRVAA